VIPIKAFLFSQGIDIQQTVANNFKSDEESGLILQYQSNICSLYKLNSFCKLFDKHTSIAPPAELNTSTSTSTSSESSMSVASSISAATVDYQSFAFRGTDCFEDVNKGLSISNSNTNSNANDIAYTNIDINDDINRNSNTQIRTTFADSTSSNPFSQIKKALSEKTFEKEPEPIFPTIQPLFNAIARNNNQKLATYGNLKFVDILLEVERIGFAIDAILCVFCKSGKDRTGVVCTYRDARYICERYRSELSQQTNDNRSNYDNNNNNNNNSSKVPSETARGGITSASDKKSVIPAISERDDILFLSNIFREYGCRIRVCSKNIGRDVFSFNSIQRQFLPTIYQPPYEVCEYLIKGSADDS
jgi:hypothetical protein